MKILFIYPDVSTDIMNFSPAIQLLSAVLKRERYETSCLHINNNGGTLYDKDTILPLTKGYDLFAVTSTSFNYKYANEIAGWLRDDSPDVLRVLGGSHATIQPEDFESSNFDIFCVGEGENAIVELCHAIEDKKDWNDIPNLITRKKINPVRGFLRDLNSLPPWDFDVMDTFQILNLRGGWLSISFSRGCPYECTFCINHLYKKVEIGAEDKMSDYLRQRSPELAVKELELLINKFPIKFFNIDDDLLTMHKKWMREFTSLYKEFIYHRYGIKYIVNARADTLTDDIVGMLADSGCFEVRIGFETGNEKLRNELLRKKTSDKSLEKAFDVLRKYKMVGIAFAMIGIPDESWETFFDTIEMTIKLKPDMVRMTFLFPYKHTRIYDICKERDLFKDDFEIENNRDFSSPLKFDKITDKELFCFRFLFPWYVNAWWHDDHVYRNAIKGFTAFPLEVLRENVSAIIEKDKELSAQCPRPHYRYYGGNEYYFELHDNIKDTI